MIPEWKVSEIKKKLRKGYPQGELVNDLLQEGYVHEEIQNTMFALSNSSKPGHKSSDFPLWYAASIGFIILGIAILSVKYIWIYNYGYIFIITGLAGTGIKYFTTTKKEK